MSAFDDLEPQQYAEIYTQDEEPLESLNTYIYSKVLLFSVLAFVFFLILGFVIQIPRELELDFVLIDQQNQQEYLLEEDVFIAENFVKQGQNITSKQKLTKITSSEILKQLNHYHQIKDALEHHQNYGNLLLKNKTDLLEININRLVQQRQKIDFMFQFRQNESKIRLNQLKYDLQEAQQRLKENQILYNSQSISKWDFKKIEADYQQKQMRLDTALIAQQHFISQIEKDLNSIDLEKNLHQKQQEQAQLDFHSKLESLEQELSRIQKNFQAKYGHIDLEKDGIVLKASQNGIIGFLHQEKQLLPQSNTLYKIIQAQRQTTAQIQVNSDNIGLLKEGMKTNLRINTFPYYEYGFLESEIKNISIVPNKEGLYFINIMIVDYGKLKNKVDIGMKGKAVVVLEEKSLFVYLFYQIKKGID